MASTAPQAAGLARRQHGARGSISSYWAGPPRAKGPAHGYLGIRFVRTAARPVCWRRRRRPQPSATCPDRIWKCSTSRPRPRHRIRDARCCVRTPGFTICTVGRPPLCRAPDRRADGRQIEGMACAEECHHRGPRGNAVPARCCFASKGEPRFATLVVKGAYTRGRLRQLILADHPSTFSARRTVPE